MTKICLGVYKRPPLIVPPDIITGLDFPENFASGGAIRLTWPFVRRTSKTVIFDVWAKVQLGYYAWWWDHDGTSEWDGGAYDIGRHPHPNDGTVLSGGQAANATGGSGADHYMEQAGAGAPEDWIADAGSSTVYPLSTGSWKKMAFTDEVVNIAGTDYVQGKFYVDLSDTSKVLTRLQALSGVTAAAPASPKFSLGSSPWRDGVGDENANAVFRNLQIYSDPMIAVDIVSEANRSGNTPVTSAGLASVLYSNINPTIADTSDKSGQGSDPSWDNANRPADYTE